MTRRNRGFTLVEILIVVIILGILAAIVIPQFTEASNEARFSSVMSDLQTTRSQIELYKIQHLDQLPVTVGGADFWAQLTNETDVDGTIVAGGEFGPYMQAAPGNPFALGDTVCVVADAEPSSDIAGWWFNHTNGVFKAVGTTPDGVDLVDY